MSVMQNINSYCIELSPEQISDKTHRHFVGGMWDVLGPLQFDFLIESGLKPDHKLLDIGCGCLRGGVHFIDYLDAGNYFGLDINSSLIEAGKIEVNDAGLSHKFPNLLVDDEFSFGRFGDKFDFMLSVSVFTHLPASIILECLKKAKLSLAPEGVYFSTFFEAPTSNHLEPVTQMNGEVITKYDSDPFHLSIDELADIAGQAGLELDVVGDWKHPRGQQMAAFRLPK